MKHVITFNHLSVYASLYEKKKRRENNRIGGEGGGNWWKNRLAREIFYKACVVFLLRLVPFSLPDLLSLTACAKFSKTLTVLSQPIQASVIETPFFSAAAPPRSGGGTSWRPSFKFDSIMTPTMLSSPAEICAAISAATMGWFCFPG